MNELVKNKIVRVLREEFGNDLWMITHMDIFDCVGDIMYEHDIELEDVESMLIYDDNWYGKSDVINNHDGLHIEELEEELEEE